MGDLARNVYSVILFGSRRSTLRMHYFSDSRAERILLLRSVELMFNQYIIRMHFFTKNSGCLQPMQSARFTSMPLPQWLVLYTDGHM